MILLNHGMMITPKEFHNHLIQATKFNNKKLTEIVNKRNIDINQYIQMNKFNSIMSKPKIKKK